MFTTRTALTMLLACLLLTLTAGRARAGSQDFQLFNRTGTNIHKLYVAPSNSENWEEDVLHGKVLINGADVMILFDPKNDAENWDIRVEDEDGDSLVWEDIHLNSAEQIILEPSGHARIK